MFEKAIERNVSASFVTCWGFDWTRTLDGRLSESGDDAAIEIQLMRDAFAMEAHRMSCDDIRTIYDLSRRDVEPERMWQTWYGTTAWARKTMTTLWGSPDMDFGWSPVYEVSDTDEATFEEALKLNPIPGKEDREPLDLLDLHPRCRDRILWPPKIGPNGPEWATGPDWSDRP